MNKKQLKKSGYTIVELMVVLAISGAMVVMAYASINGQKSKNEFTQAVRDLENKLTDVANDVVKGYFPNVGGNQECTATPIGIDFVSTTTVEQGGSENCVFAGKALNVASGSKIIQLQTLVARRTQSNGDEVYSLSDLSADDIKPAPWLNQEIELIYGLQVDNITYGPPPSSDVTSIAFLSSFASLTGGGGGGLSGAPTADVRWIPAAPASLNNPNSYNAVDYADGIKICVSQDGDARKAIVHIGQNKSLLSTYAEFDVSC